MTVCKYKNKHYIIFVLYHTIMINAKLRAKMNGVKQQF